MDGFSIIVPFYNEEEGISLFCKTIDEYASGVFFEIQLIFVDDGSADNSCEKLNKYSFKNIGNIKLIRLAKNCGSHAAIRAGLLHADFNICTWMGCDLQEPLEFLEKSYQIIKTGYDAVYVEKKTVQVGWGNRLFSKCYSHLMRKYAVKSYSSGGISNIVFNDKIKDYINNNIESNSSIMLQIMDVGYKYQTISLDYHERSAGKSKWTLKKKIKLFIDSFVSFSFMPIRLVSIFGILMFVAGVSFGIYEIIYKLTNPELPVPGYVTLAILISVGFGITNIGLGIIAEYLWRTYDAARRRPEFVISDMLNLQQKEEEKMNVRILDLTRQYQSIKEEVETAVCRQMESGQYIMGKAVADFEKTFAEYIGAKHAIAVNSGTDALIIALRSAGIKPDDEVITTPFTFFATAETVAAVGAVPVFVDVCEDTYNIDPKKIEDKITGKTKAILPVHIFGQPAEMDEINAIAQKHNLIVIEDACQAAGAEYKGKKAGALGKLGCFSFFPTKNLGAFGDGGMITTDDDELNIICRAMREHGAAQNGAKARFLLDGIEDELKGAVSEDALYNPYKYYNYLIAYNSRLDAIQAVVLNIKIKYLDSFNKRRAEIADYYNSAFAGIKDIITPKANGGGISWHQYALCCSHKDELGDYLASKSVGSAAFYPVPLHLQKAFSYLNYKEGDLPVAERLARRTVCLPIYPELKKEEQDYVIQCVEEFYRKY